jgi:hypothetical protein
MIETVWELISNDCRMTLWVMEEEPEISGETINKILVEDLRQVCYTQFD